MGVCVGVSVGAGVEVTISVGMGVNVSVEGMLVEVETGVGKVEAGGWPCPHAEMANINIQKNNRFLYFIP